jgi:hypothetical protein
MKIPSNTKWGYGLGAGLCILGLTALVLGLMPLLTAAGEKIRMIQLPGETPLTFKIPGSYIGVYLSEDELDFGTTERLRELEYSLFYQPTGEVLPVSKIPLVPALREKTEKQIPLFHFTVDRKGSYIFASYYPYQMAGPQAQVVIFAMDIRYVRAELIVGVLVFIIFLTLGIILLRRTKKGLLFS